jgi:sec-independent protein translocase protein TatA
MFVSGAPRIRVAVPEEMTMGGFGSIWHWLLIGAVALLLFGGSGKISSMMGDAAKGIKAFKDGLKDDPEDDKKAKKVEEEPKA